MIAENMSHSTCANARKQVFVGQQRMLAAAGLFDGAVDDALRGFANLAWRDVEIFYVHGGLRLTRVLSKMHASSSTCRRTAIRRLVQAAVNQ